MTETDIMHLYTVIYEFLYITQPRIKCPDVTKINIGFRKYRYANYLFIFSLLKADKQIAENGCRFHHVPDETPATPLRDYR